MCALLRRILEFLPHSLIFLFKSMFSSRRSSSHSRGWARGYGGYYGINRSPRKCSVEELTSVYFDKMTLSDGGIDSKYSPFIHPVPTGSRDLPPNSKIDTYLATIGNNIMAEHWALFSSLSGKYPGWRAKNLELFEEVTVSRQEISIDGTMGDCITHLKKPTKEDGHKKGADAGEACDISQFGYNLVIWNNHLCLLHLVRGKLVIEKGMEMADYPDDDDEGKRSNIWSYGFIGSGILEFRACNELLKVPASPILKALASPRGRDSAGVVYNRNPSWCSDVPINSRQSSVLEGMTFNVEGVQGPPGTGKSTTIFHMITSCFPADEVVLATCVQNKAVDAIAEKLSTSLEICPFIVVGNPKLLGPVASLYTLDAQVKAHPEFVALIAKIDRTCQRVKILEDRLKWHYSRRLVSSKRSQWRELAWRRRSSHPPFDRYSKEKLCDAEIEWLHRDGWRLLWESFVRAKYPDLVLDLKGLHAELSELRDRDLPALELRLTEHFVNSARALLCTVHTSSRLGLMEELKPAVDKMHSVVLDEAGTVPESKLPVLVQLGVTRVVAIGDQKQLAPFTRLKVVPGGSKPPTGFFDRLTRALDSSAVPMLTHQYRMHPDICAFVSSTFYQGSLQTPPEVEEARRKGMAAHRGISWVDYEERDAEAAPTRGNRTSKVNETEVNLVQRFLRAYGGALAGKSVMIITFYKGQQRLLEESLKDVVKDTVDSGRAQSVRIVSVDASQGSEADVVVLSCVRCNSKRSIGFLGNPNRMCVGVSRAREWLVVVGSGGTVTVDGKWKALYGTAARLLLG